MEQNSLFLEYTNRDNRSIRYHIGLYISTPLYWRESTTAICLSKVGSYNIQLIEARKMGFFSTPSSRSQWNLPNSSSIVSSSTSLTEIISRCDSLNIFFGWHHS